MRTIRFSVASVLLVIAAFGANVWSQGVELSSNVVASFASVEQGRAILTKRDDFIAALSPQERAGRMLTNQPVSEKDFLAFVGQNVLAWTPGETNRLGGILQVVGKKLAPWHLPFPSTILLVKTTGREEIEADYTRQNAIMLPQGLVPSLNTSVVTHELFHVLSRNNPALRAKLYGIIGFTRINDIEPPDELKPLRWINPDGVQNGWLMTLTNQNQPVQCVTDLFAPEKFDPTQPVNPFGFFRLLVVTNGGGQWSPKLVDGHPQLFRVREVQGFYEQVGRNTQYLIHPDEILADNFVRLINGDTNLQTPRIIEEMKKVFESERK